MTEEDSSEAGSQAPLPVGARDPQAGSILARVGHGVLAEDPLPSPPVHFGSWGFSRCDDSLLSRDSKSWDLSIHSRNSSWKLLEASHCCKCWDPAWAIGASAPGSCHCSRRDDCRFHFTWKYRCGPPHVPGLV